MLRDKTFITGFFLFIVEKYAVFKKDGLRELISLAAVFFIFQIIYSVT